MIADDLRVLKEGKSITVEEEFNGRFYTTTKFPILKKGRPPYIAGYTIDITRQRQLEKEIVEVEAREQLRIGHDLHDGLGQHLTGLELSCRAIENKLIKGTKVRARDIDKIAVLVSQAADHVRHLSKGLSPVEGKPDGLIFALQELARNTEQTFGISCKFYCIKKVLIPDPFIATHLFRVIQEAVTNAIRHGQARKVRIKMSQSASKIVLTVEDNGTGISKPFPTDRGMGLKIMQYRTNLIGAALKIEHGEKTGTIVRCTLTQSRDGKK